MHNDNLAIVRGFLSMRGHRVGAALDKVHTEPAVALRKWLANHDVLETYQFTVRDGQVVRAWAPGPREIELRATFALFDGSRREFASVSHIAHNADTYVAWDADMSTILVYTTP